MAQVRITKKGIIVLVVVLSVISFGLGFGVWKVTGLPNLSPIDSDAAGDGSGAPKCNYTPKQIADYAAKNCPGKAVNCDSSGNLYCLSGARYQCCDGTWAIGDSGASACGTKNWGGACEQDNTSQNCWCKSFKGCGEKCTFPPGTGAKVQKMAENSCGRFMAFCEVDSQGNTKVSIGEAGDCWEQRHICENPASENVCEDNICEGGGLTGGSGRVTTTVGQSVEFCGYAYDVDGIDVNNINVKIDGTIVGKATVTDACTNPADPICTQYAGKKPVKWCYTYTATTEGDKVISAEWKDTKGVTGASCKASREFTTAVVQDEWVVDKNAARMCVDSDPNDVKVQLNYTITITNSAEEIKEISKIVDTLDTKVQSSYIQLQTINPGATVEGNVITWNLTGDAAKFNPGQTKTFTYTIVVPKTAFGTYYNKAEITPVGSDENIVVDETIIASCDIPDTAIFDTVQSRLAVGVFLILVALAYVYIDPFETGVNKMFGKLADNITPEGRLRKSREKFEKRVVS